MASADLSLSADLSCASRVSRLYEFIPRPAQVAKGFDKVATAVLQTIIGTHAPIFTDYHESDEDVTPAWYGACDVMFLPPSFDQTVQCPGIRAKLRRLHLPEFPDGLRCVPLPPDLTEALLSVAAQKPEVVADEDGHDAPRDDGSSSAETLSKAKRTRLSVLSRHLLSDALRPLAPSAPSVLSTRAAEMFTPAEASLLLLWLLERPSESELKLTIGPHSKSASAGSIDTEAIAYLDGVPLVPLHLAAETSDRGTSSSTPPCSRVLGVLRLRDGVKASPVQGTLFMNLQASIDAKHMLQGCQQLIQMDATCVTALQEEMAHGRLNVRPLSPDALASGLVEYVIPQAWCGYRIYVDDEKEITINELSHVAQSDAQGANIAGSTGTGTDAVAARKKPSGGGGRDGSKAHGGKNAGPSAGKKDKVKQRQLARRDQRQHKETRHGDDMQCRGGLADEAEEGQTLIDDNASLGAQAVQGERAALAAKGEALGVHGAEVSDALGRLCTFWKFLEEFPYWHDADNRLDVWPLIASNEGPQLLPRKQALNARILLAQDLAPGEETLLQRFGALTLHERFRSFSRPIRWACSPRREALTALYQAQVQMSKITANKKSPLSETRQLTRAECLELRVWVRRFIQQEHLLDFNEASHFDDDAEDVDASQGNHAHEPYRSVVPLARLLSALPIFDTVANGPLVALHAMKVAGGSCRPVGAPSEDPFAAVSPWDDVLGEFADWSCRLLSYKDPDALWLLKAIGHRREQLSDFLPLLRSDLLNMLPQAGCLLYLKGVGQSRPWRHVGSAEHNITMEACRSLRLVVWGEGDPIPHPDRCRACDCLDPEDSGIRSVSEALSNHVLEHPSRAQADGSALQSLPFPPRSFCQDADVILALRHAGLRNLSVHETFTTLAERAAAIGCVEAGEALVAFLLQQPTRFIKVWPPVAWMKLRRIAFIPCHDCTKGASDSFKFTPPALHAGECHSLAKSLSGPSSGVTAPPRNGGRNTSTRGGQAFLFNSRRAGGAARSAAAALEAQQEELAFQEDERDDSVEEEDDSNNSEARKDSAIIDLLQRAEKLMQRDPLGGNGGSIRLVSSERTMPSDYIDRWHTWEVVPFLPKAWERVPDALRSVLLPKGPKDRVVSHLRILKDRIESTDRDYRSAWRGPLLWAMVVLRGLQVKLPRQLSFQPVVVLDDGEVCRVQDLHLDLSQDLGVGVARVRALPAYLRGLRSLLVRLGVSSASVDVPGVEVSAPNPFAGSDAALDLLQSALNDPTFADVVFHFDSEAAGVPNKEAYGHRLVLGRASEVFRNMVSGPMSISAQHPDGKLHISLPSFIEPDPFQFMLAHIYTGVTVEAGQVLGKVLMPPNFESAQLICSVMQLADHFFLPHLKEWCESYLAQPELLTIESIVDILTHADGCNASQLFYVCVHQISKLQDAVLQTERWAMIPDALKQRVSAEFRRHGKNA
eukprot:TRINITY_DN32653_c0_g1_i1.p1 TRINITY_DN32653_c0_g1~~TRINITY_DN32653_c0_g1_i1.p1  ORF type:complete len:1674 (-),score=170.81 TRINITY_DN32653_c0_g1_i1:255-4607(-)